MQTHDRGDRLRPGTSLAEVRQPTITELAEAQPERAAPVQSAMIVSGVTNEADPGSLRLPSPRMVRPLLLLDLDETLIHSSTKELTGLKVVARVGDLNFYARPHLETFLKTVEPLYQLGVWTAASADYASIVVSAIFSTPANLALVWSRERCCSSYDPETGDLRYLKDLKKVKRQGYDLAQTLFIDDIPGNLRKNYGNHIRIPPFTGAADDRALINLAAALSDDTIFSHRDFRRVDKRGWSYRAPS